MTVNTTTGAMNEAEVTFDNSDIYTNADAAMTFDDLGSDMDEETVEAPKSFDEEDEDEEVETEESDEEELGSEELKLLNDSDGKGPKKEEKKKEEKKEEESEDEGESEESEEEKDITKAAADEKGKKLRIKVGDDYYSLDSNAQMKVKIDGQNQDVSIQDLVNHYSGKVAWDKKFTEIGNEKKTLMAQKQVLESEKYEMKQVFQPAIDAIKDPTKNPNEALILLAEKLDSTGELAYAIEKRLLEANLDTLVELSTMSEVEQNAYFLKKQNERLLKSSEKRKMSELEAQKSNQLRAQVDQIREAYGVSVDQYSEAFEELRSLLPDRKDLTHEHVVDWASLKPITPQIVKVLEPFADEINDADFSGIVTHLSRSLRDGKMSIEQIQKIVKEEFGVPASVKELNTKLNIGKKKSPAKEPEAKSDKFESFEDFED